jgi:hypothetical protein
LDGFVRHTRASDDRSALARPPNHPERIDSNREQSRQSGYPSVAVYAIDKSKGSKPSTEGAVRNQK